MVLEIAAYYVPFFDNVLDTLSAPVAVLAGIVASASLLTDLPPWLQYTHRDHRRRRHGRRGPRVDVVAAIEELGGDRRTSAIRFIATLELIGSVLIAVIALLAPLIALIVAV